jgi:hypothetical protein
MKYKIIAAVALFITTITWGYTQSDGAIVYSQLVKNPLNALVVKAKINNSISGNFILDSGLAEDEDNGGLIVDSAFFYKYIDTTNLVRIKPRIKMHYWYTCYRGNISIAIGEHLFYIHNIKVVSEKRKQKRENFEADGTICRNVFWDKITLVDFDRDTIAFAETIMDTSNYISIPLHVPRQLKRQNFDEKYIEIRGFKTKSGKKKSGRFLFDTGNYGSGIVFKYSFGKDIPVGKKKMLVSSGYNIGKKEWLWRIDSLSVSGKLFLERGIVCSKLAGEPTDDNLDALVGGDGLLGMTFLKRFNFIIDYKHNTLYMSKHPTTFYRETIIENDKK